MELVADIDRERSLDAMWCAYLTSNSVAENLAKNRTSVVRAFLNARYYNSAQGQFLSEDPVFLGDPKNQVLTDPQSLNSYSYANDNPIVKSDPNGKFVIPLLLGAVEVYGLAMTAIDAYNVYNTEIASTRSGSTPNDKAQANLQIAYDGTQQAVAKAFAKRGWKEVSPTIGVLQASLDVITNAPDIVNYYRNGDFTNNISEVSSRIKTNTRQMSAAATCPERRTNLEQSHLHFQNIVQGNSCYLDSKRMVYI